MTNREKILDSLTTTQTPVYVYDTEVLNLTLDALDKARGKYNVHYAVKANNSERIVRIIAERGYGADCVSIGEIEFAIKCGIRPDRIAYAGVGKTEKEIVRAIDLSIGCFNVESVEELMIIAEIAEKKDAVANVALRINPDIDAHTHHCITTGLAENKFGIDMSVMDDAVKYAASHKNLNFKGLHFHIGSQILYEEPFVLLAERINELLDHIENKLGIEVKSINTGGGLGIDYDTPDKGLVPVFDHYFKPLLENLKLRENQELHCEFGRSIVAQCGTLIGEVQYVKKTPSKRIVILDAGMNNLIRPALYQAHHHIENISSRESGTEIYDIVGPICESTDEFAAGLELPVTKRGDYLAIRSAGAYGASMSSGYNMRPDAKEIFI